jgi:beta-lactamase superfamily II metal-dependent hydrolase
MKTFVQKIINDLDSYSGVIKVKVRDVGHGNWNEIKYSNKRILFDIGAQKNFGEEDLLNIINNAKFKIGEEIYIFISHWDVDHYHAILKLTNKELQLIKAIFGPSNIPKTNTAKRAMNVINHAKIKYYGIPFTAKRHLNKKIELNLLFSGSKIKLFRSSPTRSRNLDSIVIFLEGNNNSVLFSGDNTYEKIFDYVLTICQPHVPLNFILPHHGGRAGNFNISTWTTLPLENIIISFCEKNSYGHPLPKNLKVSQKLLGSKPLLVTNGSGDQDFKL